MPLSPADVEKLNNWLRTKCSAMICPCCGSSAWGLGELGTMLPLQENVIQLHGDTTPAVPILCHNCGYIRLFSAVVLGLLSKARSPKDGQTSEQP